MNEEKTVQDIAVAYKETGDTKDIDILYTFVKRMTNSIAFKYKVQYNEDIAQDAMLKVLEKIHQYNPDKSGFHNWVYAIIANMYKQYFKKNARSAPDIEVGEVEFDKETKSKWNVNESYVPDYFEDEEPVLTGYDIIDAFSTYIPYGVYKKKCNAKISTADMKKIFISYVVYDKSHAEISEEMNVSVSLIKIVIYRLRADFINYLYKLYPDKKFPKQLYGKEAHMGKGIKRGNRRNRECELTDEQIAMIEN